MHWLTTCGKEKVVIMTSTWDYHNQYPEGSILSIEEMATTVLDKLQAEIQSED